MPPPVYELLPSAEEDKISEHSSRRTHNNRVKKVLFHVLAVAAVMFVVFQGLRSFVRSSSKFLHAPPCHGRNLSSLPSHFTLPSGAQIPSVALGVWKASPGEVGPAVETALKSGYRHIDGAWIYGNEAEVGAAIKKSGIPRDELWLTSKLWNTFHAPEDIEPALDESLAHLDTEYLDLYLVHWPIAFKRGTSNELDVELTANPYPTWAKLEELVDKGKIRNIGISNIKNLTANPLKHKPAVNQVELNYWNPQPELLQWSKENGLLLEAYSPLGSSDQVKETLRVPEVLAIAKELGITPAQVLISWHVQRGTIVLPKSVTPSRVVENLKVVALPDDLFKKLEEAATSHKPKRILNPSKGWKLDFDVFDENLPF
ncbi:hypothetical protein PHLCEN_2v10426 [Hermanssonia centrifuga]|uniref:NADP-dependent oxidoreductase domain-containing protein n=1 Tax=Hermanssonia centrifuga TaxID=98765 RepID=A0A2R6NMZ6_9APHY|nr:hypothetical protein PHLCEN_2v10426 [Hermanssonia centrifuga]